MRHWILFSLILITSHSFAQLQTKGVKRNNSSQLSNNNSSSNSLLGVNNSNGTSKAVKKDTVVSVDLYKIFSSDYKTMPVDTTLTISNYYKTNYLKKDLFGLQSLSNDGMTLSTLDHSLTKLNAQPNFGFHSNDFNYYDIDAIDYYKVPTAFTELSYRSAIKQGQSLNTLFTTNINERFNVFIGYRGIRSLGSYINELVSSGNFKIGGSYNGKEKRYYLRTHFTGQDISTQQNSGITDLDLFQSSKDPYNNRERLNIYTRDAKTLFKGTRFFLDHKFKLNPSAVNEIWIKHKFYYEYKTNLYEQATLTTVDSDIIYYGSSYTNSIQDKSRFKNLYNSLGLSYKSDHLGELTFLVDYASFDYYYNSIVVTANNQVIPSGLNYDQITLGGSYALIKEDFELNASAKQSISNIPLTEIKGQLDYTVNDAIQVKLDYQFLSKVPDMTQQLFQSSYVNYNWHNNFSNEVIQSLGAKVTNPYVNVSANVQMINDKIYYSNNNKNFNSNGIAAQQLITPKQYGKAIGYFNVKLQRDIPFGKFGLDNTLLFQHVSQDENILNVPAFVTRNTIYYSDHLFQRALFLQTGIGFNYHTKYYGNEFNPIVGEFYSQDTRKIGGFPTFDFFVNAKIRTARVYIALEHFNYSVTGYDYYSTPTRPFRDMTIRFGLVWDFFN